MSLWLVRHSQRCPNCRPEGRQFGLTSRGPNATTTGLCREIEFRDLDDPPTGFPLDDEACAWTRRNNAFRSSGSAEQLAGWSLIVVGDRFVRSRSELSPRALTVLSVGSSRVPRPWSA